MAASKWEKIAVKRTARLPFWRHQMKPNDIDLFDPGHYAKVRLPLLEAETMPPWTYTSDAFYNREVDRIFKKVWNFLGHVDQVAKPGDYFALNFVGSD
jgi:hypothetical protein